MFTLSAFADEISPDLDEQIEHCKRNGVTHFELRGVAGKNVLDFDNALQQEIKTKLADNGLAVASIGSPSTGEPSSKTSKCTGHSTASSSESPVERLSCSPLSAWSRSYCRRC